MRLVSYNILEGGEGRADPLAETIEARRPDIIVLVEADDAAVLERIARRMKMDFIHGAGNQKSSAAILSRWPIRESINHALLRPGISRAFLEATIKAPDGRQWIVGALHLHARATEDAERRREAELAQVLEAFDRHRQARTPHLLAGDFNSNSPIQQIDLAKVKPSTRQAYEHNGNVIPRRVVQALLDAGYVDSLAAHDPAGAANIGSFTTQFPGQRVDYIFTHGIDPARIRAAWIEQDRLAQFASDHYPIGVEIADA